MVPIVIAFLSSTHLFIVAIDGIGREKSITTSNNSVNSAISEVKVKLKLFSIEFILLSESQPRAVSYTHLTLPTKA